MSSHNDMVFQKNNTAKTKKPKAGVFLPVTEQQVLAALEVLEKKNGGALPSGTAIQKQMERMGLTHFSQPTISRAIKRLESMGKIERRLVVMA